MIASDTNYKNAVCETFYLPGSVSVDGCVNFYDSLIGLVGLGSNKVTNETEFFAACMQYKLVHKYGFFPEQDECSGYVDDTFKYCPIGLGGKCAIQERCEANTNLLYNNCTTAVTE